MRIGICDDDKAAIESVKRELETVAEKLQIAMDIRLDFVNLIVNMDGFLYN